MGKAQRRGARLLQRAGFNGEQVVILDSGKNMSTHSRIDLIATDAALYLWSPDNGFEGRFSYDNLTDVWAPTEMGSQIQGDLRFGVLGLVS